MRQAGILEEQLKELDIYVNEVSKLYNTLSETLGADNMFLSPKGAAVDRLLSSGKPITAQTIEQEMLTDKGSGVTINVYGAEGQDVSELAEIVSQKIAKNTRQERMAW